MLVGTIVNSIAIIIGSLIGVVISRLMKKHSKFAVLPDIIMKAVALCVIYIGISGALKDRNTLVMILSMAAGTVIGSIIDINKRLEVLGNFIQTKAAGKRVKKAENYSSEANKQYVLTKNGSAPTDKAAAFSENLSAATGTDIVSTEISEEKSENKIAEGFVSATLLFCVGAMAITGALNSGLSGGTDRETLYAKSVLDFISSIVFGSTLGIGSALSAISVFLYQGIIELASGAIRPLLNEYTIAEMTSVGSLLIAALGLNMLGVTKIKTANMLPAIFLPMIFCLFIK